MSKSKTPVAMAGGLPVYCAHHAIVPTDSLRPHPKNPNKHNQRQVTILAKVIQQNGWRAPITVSELSGCIIAGHGRLMAAKELGLKEVPIERQHFKSDAAEIEHLIADNRIAELAELDESALLKLLDETKGLDLEMTGFDMFDLDDLRPKPEPPPADKGTPGATTIKEALPTDGDAGETETDETGGEEQRLCPHCGKPV